MQWIQVRKDTPQKIFFKYSLNEDIAFDSVNFAKRGRPAPAASLTPLHDQPRPLS